MFTLIVVLFDPGLIIFGVIIVLCYIFIIVTYLYSQDEVSLLNVIISLNILQLKSYSETKKKHLYLGGCLTLHVNITRNQPKELAKLGPKSKNCV